MTLMSCLMGLFATASSDAREIRTIYLPGAGKALKKAYLANQKTAIEIKFPQRNLSPPVDIPEGELVFAVLPEPPVDDEKISPTAPRVKIPRSWKHCLIIFLSDPSNKVFPVKAIPVNADNENLPKGKTLIFNLSETMVHGKFGTREVTLKSGKSKSFDAPIRKFGSYQVAIKCLVKGEKRSRVITRTSWQHDPEVRQLLFVVPQKGREIPRVWGVLDRFKEPESRR